MTAPQQGTSRFSADFLVVAMVAIYVVAIGMAFVLTQQHEDEPAWLTGILVAGLPIIFAYKANSVTPAQIQSVSTDLDHLQTSVDLNHLDTTNKIAAAATAPTPSPPPEHVDVEDLAQFSVPEPPPEPVEATEFLPPTVTGMNPPTATGFPSAPTIAR